MPECNGQNAVVEFVSSKSAILPHDKIAVFTRCINTWNCSSTKDVRNAGIPCSLECRFLGRDFSEAGKV